MQLKKPMNMERGIKMFSEMIPLLTDDNRMFFTRLLQAIMAGSIVVVVAAYFLENRKRK